MKSEECALLLEGTRPASCSTYGCNAPTHVMLDCSLNCEPFIPSGFVRVLYPSDRKPCYITKPCQERQLRVSGFLDFCLSFCFSAQKNVNSYWSCLSQQLLKSGFFFFLLSQITVPVARPQTSSLHQVCLCVSLEELGKETEDKKHVPCAVSHGGFEVTGRMDPAHELAQL